MRLMMNKIDVKMTKAVMRLYRPALKPETATSYTSTRLYHIHIFSYSTVLSRVICPSASYANCCCIRVMPVISFIVLPVSRNR